MIEEKEVKIEVKEDDNLYISDLLCWIKGFLEGKGDEYENYWLLHDACNRLKDINRQLKDILMKKETNDHI